MPTITVNKHELLSLIGTPLSDEELSTSISMLGTDLDRITDEEVCVEIFPNRPDLLSAQGLARALRSFLGYEKGLRRYPVKKSGKRVIIDKSVLDCRPYTSCAIVRGLHITEERLKSIIQIQEKLHITFGRNRKRAAIGIYPLEHIQFPIRFAGLRPDEIRFQPLEAGREMSGPEILSQHPKGKEYAHLLDGLKRYACFLDATGSILSLTPIINSERTGKITEKTSAVFVECSGFDQRVLNECLAIIVTALADMGGRIESLELLHPEGKRTTPDLTPRTMRFDVSACNKLLGTTLSAREAAGLLEKMGFGVQGATVRVPAYRTDILHEADLIEDIAIAYGYENFAEELPVLGTVGRADPAERLNTVIREVLVGLGLVEVHNFNLIGAATQTQMMERAIEVVRVAHSISKEYDSLRAWLLPSLMETLARNKRHEYPQNIFEIGTSFVLDSSTPTGVRETPHLAIALCGERADYTAIKQILEALYAALGREQAYTKTRHESFLEGRAATTEHAVLGEVAPAVLANFGLEMPVAACELDLAKLQ